MIDIRNQKIGDIINSNVILVNGDLNIDGVIYSDIKTTFFEILRNDFDKFSAVAIKNAENEVEKCIRKILEKMEKEQCTHLTEKFQTLSIQTFLHDTLIGYTSAEDENIKESIIDILIDRLKFQDFSTEKSIISDAIKIIPHLNTTTSALIALMMLRNQIVNVPISLMLEDYFKQLSPIVDSFSNIKNIDIEYIIQNGCTKTIPGLLSIDTFENHLLKHYDLFFRNRVDKGVVDLFTSVHPEIMNQVNDIGTCMFCSDYMEVNYWYFSDINSKLFYDRLKSRGQCNLIPLIEELKEKMPPLTPTEVREYFNNLNTNWNHVFNILNSTALNRLSLSIVGQYLGTKFLGKYTASSSLSISDFNNPIYL